VPICQKILFVLLPPLLLLLLLLGGVDEGEVDDDDDDDDGDEVSLRFATAGDHRRQYSGDVVPWIAHLRKLEITRLLIN